MFFKNFVASPSSLVFISPPQQLGWDCVAVSMSRMCDFWGEASIGDSVSTWSSLRTLIVGIQPPYRRSPNERPRVGALAGSPSWGPIGGPSRQLASTVRCVSEWAFILFQSPAVELPLAFESSSEGPRHQGTEMKLPCSVYISDPEIYEYAG